MRMRGRRLFQATPATGLLHSGNQCGRNTTQDLRELHLLEAILGRRITLVQHVSQRCFQTSQSFRGHDTRLRSSPNVFLSRANRCISNRITPHELEQKRWQHVNTSENTTEDASSLERATLSALPKFQNDSPSGVLEYTNTQSQAEAEDDRIEEPFENLVERWWNVIEAGCNRVPAAMPSISVKKMPRDHTTGEDHLRGCWEVTMLNKRFGIRLQRRFKSNKSLRRDFPAFATEYARLINERIQDLDKGIVRWNNPHVSPYDFVMRARRRLGLGALRFSLQGTDHLSHAKRMAWHRICLRKGEKEPAGDLHTWFSLRGARTLAVCAEVQELYDELKEALDREEILPEDFQPFTIHTVGDEAFYAEQFSERSGRRKPLQPFPMAIKADTLAKMASTLSSARLHGLPDTCEWVGEEAQGPRNASVSLESEQASVSEGLLTRRQPPWDDKAKRKALPIMNPNVKDEIIHRVSSNDVVIICAATGSGKTTQVPQILLDDYIQAGLGSECNILCTQPRRIAATSVAHQVAYERKTSLGEEVGYHVRYDNKLPTHAGSITYATTGLALRLLQSDHLDLLSRYSHIILDEVHVRDLDTDILLTRFRDLLAARASNGLSRPKLLLMSATIDAPFFENYFRAAHSRKPLRVSSLLVPGTTFHVDTHMLEDILPRLEREFPSQLRDAFTTGEEGSALTQFLKDQCGPVQGFTNGVEQQHDTSDTNEVREASEDPVEVAAIVPINLLALTVAYVASTTETGDILVFLPGLAEIDNLSQTLLTYGMSIFDGTRFKLFKLHSAMYETNSKVFDPVPSDCRRIILATNIAETSLTLPDVVHVIDSGRARTTLHDPVNQRTEFNLKWISKAELIQRRGRAGRVRPGHYYGMYSRSHELDQTPVPEILRVDLCGMVLGQEILGRKIWENRATDTYQGDMSEQTLAESLYPTANFLSRAPTPPSTGIIKGVLKELERVKAIVKGPVSYEVSALGSALTRLPVAPAVGKALLLGTLFQCIDPFLIIAAESHDTPLFGHVAGKRAINKARNEFSGYSRSDRVASIRGFQDYVKAIREGDEDAQARLESEHFVRESAVWEVIRASSQIHEVLTKAAILPLPEEEKMPEEFPTSPEELNANSLNVGLIKALTLVITGPRLAVWKYRHFRGKESPRVLVEPRSVNKVKRSKPAAESIDYREQGSVVAYEVMRVSSLEPFPWLYHTSRITPLTAILFGDSVRLEEGEVLIIDDWLPYKITCDDPRFPQPARLILEFRKAVERWLVVAFSDLKLSPVSEKSRIRHANMIFDWVNHPLRRDFVNCLANIMQKEEEQSIAQVKGPQDDASTDATPEEEGYGTSSTDEAKEVEEVKPATPWTPPLTPENARIMANLQRSRAARRRTLRRASKKAAKQVKKRLASIKDISMPAEYVM